MDNIEKKADVNAMFKSLNRQKGATLRIFDQDATDEELFTYLDWMTGSRSIKIPADYTKDGQVHYVQNYSEFKDWVTVDE